MHPCVVALHNIFLLFLLLQGNLKKICTPKFQNETTLQVLVCNSTIKQPRQQCALFTIPRILKDETMADKLVYIPNDDTQNRRLQLVVEKFGHST